MINLTQPEALFLRERLLCHGAFIEKMGFYVSQCEDMEIRQILQRQQQQYQRQYDAVRSLVEGATAVVGTPWAGAYPQQESGYSRTVSQDPHYHYGTREPETTVTYTPEAATARAGEITFTPDTGSSFRGTGAAAEKEHKTYRAAKKDYSGDEDEEPTYQ